MDFAQRTKIEAFFAEFPHLSRYFNRGTIHEVQVKRWDDKLLNLYPASISKEDNGFSVDARLDRHKIYLLDKEGQLIAAIGERVQIVWWNPLSWIGHALDVTNDGRVYAEMLKLGEDVCGRVSVIASLHKRSGTEHAGNKISDGITLTVWKAPAGHENLADWLKEWHELELRTQPGIVAEN